MATDIKNDATLSTSLISHWELEEASGTRVDSHGSNDLTDNNTVGQGTGKQGNCADFEDTNTEYLSITDASQSGLDFNTGDLSFSFWAAFESFPAGGSEILSKFNATDGYGIILDGTQKLVINYYSGGNRTKLTTDAAITTSGEFGTFIHIAGAIDVSANTWTVYKNDSSVAVSTTLSAASAIGNSSVDFNMGRRTASTLYVDGLIDEVSMWNKILSSAEVTDLYNSGSGIPYDAGSAFVPKVMFF